VQYEKRKTVLLDLRGGILSYHRHGFLDYNIQSAMPGLTKKGTQMKITSVSSLALAAAFAGLLGGTTARLNAQPVSGHSDATVSTSANAGVLVAQDTPAPPKHSCKGKNDCKGQGGGDAKHAGKNSCKGKGACATDGSKPPKA
jgi:hypothetical protein